MKRLLVFLVLLFAIFFSYTVVAQEMGSIRKGYTVSIPEKIHKLVLDPLPAGTYSIGTGGYFPTIDSAFNMLSIDGIAGEVILELTDNLYTAPTTQHGFTLIGPIPGAGPDSRVTIRPADNKNVIIEGSGQAVLWLLNTSYMTIDGIGTTGATTLSIHTISNDAFDWNDGIDFNDNSDHNVIQNIVFNNEDETRGGGGASFWAEGSSAPDSNLIQNNFVKRAGLPLFVSCYSSSARGKGNIIRGNQIGSETDSLIAWGIQIEKCQNTIVENNIVQNVKCTHISGEIISMGINSYSGSGDIIRNNIVHNIKSSTGYSSTGIELSGGSGSNNLIYNNMVYDIQSTSSQSDSRVAGIQIWLQTSPKIYYNTVYLSGNGANYQGSAAFYVYGGFGNSVNVETKNNIFVNTRDESPYCASAIFRNLHSSFTTSDYNDLYFEPNQYNCLVRINTTNYNTLLDWQATGQDINSITEMPNFNDTYLHIDESIPTNLESGATPITDIETDIDGDTRNAATPDIGADEFNGTVVGIHEEPIKSLRFSLEQNWPNPFNPTTTIGFGIQNKSNVKITVLNLIGEEVAVILDKEKEAGYHQIVFNAANLPSGVYFYQIRAGNFMNTKKMILLK